MIENVIFTTVTLVGCGSIFWLIWKLCRIDGSQR